MAIKKHTINFELNDRTTTTTPIATASTSSSQNNEVNAPTITQQRSQDLPCSECPRQRRVVFTREHTRLRRNPALITCPNCLQGVETIVERRCNSTTHLSALLLLPVCLCAVPYCSKMLRDSIHRCPSCGIALGAHFSSAHESLVTSCFTAQHDRLNAESFCNTATSERQFF